MYKAAIFDMDGTILDTVEDLNAALNHALKETGHKHAFTAQDTKNFFGSGVQVAITRALCKEKGMDDETLNRIGTPEEKIAEGVRQEEIERVQEVFRAYYVGHCDIHTKPYEGIMELLKKLRMKGVKLAVVSNKQDDAVQELVDRLFEDAFDFHLGEKAGIKRKPAPDMCDECLRVLKIDRSECVYIGDSEVDIETAINSRMDVISVCWGFRSVDYLKEHGARKIVSNIDELYGQIMK